MNWILARKDNLKAAKQNRRKGSDEVNVGRLIISVLVLVGVICSSIPFASAMSMEEACGNTDDNLASFSKGRWLPWTDDHLDQEGLDAALVDGQRKLLTELSEPFMSLKVLNPPPGVEAMPHRSIGEKQEMGEPVAGARFIIRIFHPTYEEAGESSAKVEVFVNNLLPLFYGIGGGEIKDDGGSMFLEPSRVGELGGAAVYWSGRPRDCIAVFKANERPLWLPVSQERYLRAQIKAVEDRVEYARSEYMAARHERARMADSMPDMAQQEELIRQMKAINPDAAIDMEKQLAAMREMMEQKLPEMQKEADRNADSMGDLLEPELNKFRAELSAMTPAQRAAPAYLGGLSGSKTTLLSHPDDRGARALVAPQLDYFAAASDPAKPQLLIIEFSSGASHAPEAAIITRLRKELDWRQFWRFVGSTASTTQTQHRQQTRQPVVSQPDASTAPTAQVPGMPGGARPAQPVVSPAEPLIRPATETFERIGPTSGVTTQQSGLTATRAQWAQWGELAWDATKTAVNTRWVQQAYFRNVTINSSIAIGPPGCLQGPDLSPIIRSYLLSNEVPVEVVDIFANSIGGAFAAWQGSVAVPGLPWYPAFAAFPGPQAPPMPNVPMPLISLAAARQAELTSADRLSEHIFAQFPSGEIVPDVREEILSFSRKAATQFQVWLASTQIRNVQGHGPVPTFAPPYVPVGPVVAGGVIPTPGVINGRLR